MKKLLLDLTFAEIEYEQYEDPIVGLHFIHKTLEVSIEGRLDYERVVKEMEKVNDYSKITEISHFSKPEFDIPNFVSWSVVQCF